MAGVELQGRPFAAAVWIGFLWAEAIFCFVGAARVALCTARFTVGTVATEVARIAGGQTHNAAQDKAADFINPRSVPDRRVRPATVVLTML